MGNYRDLRVWHECRRLTESVYRHTEGFPTSERYGLSSQARRAAISIGANLAEGVGRGTDPDTARFLRYAIGSANEVEHHLVTACDIGLLADEDLKKLTNQISEIRRMLSGLHTTIQRRSS